MIDSQNFDFSIRNCADFREQIYKEFLDYLFELIDEAEINNVDDIINSIINDVNIQIDNKIYEILLSYKEIFQYNLLKKVDISKDDIKKALSKIKNIITNNKNIISLSEIFQPKHISLFTALYQDFFANHFQLDKQSFLYREIIGSTGENNFQPNGKEKNLKAIIILCYIQCYIDKAVKY